MAIFVEAPVADDLLLHVTSNRVRFTPIHVGATATGVTPFEYTVDSSWTLPTCAAVDAYSNPLRAYWQRAGKAATHSHFALCLSGVHDDTLDRRVHVDGVYECVAEEVSTPPSSRCIVGRRIVLHNTVDTDTHDNIKLILSFVGLNRARRLQCAIDDGGVSSMGDVTWYRNGDKLSNSTLMGR
jgi:hypothetical protein